VITETLTVYRGGTDKYGETYKEAHGTVSGVFAWGPGVTTTRARRDQDLKGESSAVQVELYVNSGADLKVRDRIRRPNGQAFNILAGPMWDCPQPQTGHNFGWKVFQVEAITD
jgi:hypothetical protein